MSDYYPSSDELRDAWINESTSFPGDAETVEDNTLGDRSTIPCRLCGNPTLMLGTKLCDRCWELETRIENAPEIARRILLQIDALKPVAVNVAPSSAIPEDAEEELSDWYRERDQIQNERDLEEAAWHKQELLQEETDT